MESRNPTFERFEIDQALGSDTKLYRYISLESFMAFVESKQTYLSNINQWNDPWEAILAKVPTIDDKGKQTVPSYSFYQGIFGQCWSKLPESDALWRIYSPSGTGILISTTVERFKLLRGVKMLYIGPVVYLENVPDLLKKAEQCRHPFGDARLKRKAFQHEEEVRLLTHSDFMDNCRYNARYVTLDLDSVQFLCSVVIDPRAPDWFVDSLKSYCRRVGFSFEPFKSQLYSPNPQLTIGVARQWAPVRQNSNVDEV